MLKKKSKIIISGSIQNLKKITSRIAPTPSGFLHLGNAFSFLLTWLFIKKFDGYLHLKIDDIDQNRTKIKYLDDIFLSWNGWVSNMTKDPHRQVILSKIILKFLK